MAAKQAEFVLPEELIFLRLQRIEPALQQALQTFARVSDPKLRKASVEFDRIYRPAVKAFLYSFERYLHV